MLAWFRTLPLFVVLLWISAGAMVLPAAMAVLTEDFATGRRFFYASLMTMIAATLIGIATQGNRTVATERRQLVTLVLSYLLLPLILAIPMEQAVSATRFINVYLDMVSALTTTGAVVFDPDRLPPAVHLWRATVGWLGGLLIWVSAMAVLAPLNLGGYEVTSEARVEGQIQTSLTQTGAAGAAERLRRSAAQLTPVYGVLTIILSFGLLLAGEEPLVAVIHAMSTMATSGITPVDGLGRTARRYRGRGADRGLPRLFACRAGPSAADSTGHGPNGWRATARRGWRASQWWCCPRFCSCATGSVRWRSRRWPISATRSRRSGAAPSRSCPS
jgi:trk system potassium uptake protein TrkH